MMKIRNVWFVAAILAAVVTLPVGAAPVESVDSARATVAWQKIDGFLSDAAVAKQLTTLGLSRAQVDAQLARLSDVQLEQLAAQVDTIRAGGMIQSGPPKFGPIGCFFRQLGILLHNVYQTVFCWGPLK
jgi:hypothetical protein